MLSVGQLFTRKTRERLFSNDTSSRAVHPTQLARRTSGVCTDLAWLATWPGAVGRRQNGGNDPVARHPDTIAVRQPPHQPDDGSLR